MAQEDTAGGENPDSGQRIYAPILLRIQRSYVPGLCGLCGRGVASQSIAADRLEDVLNWGRNLDGSLRSVLRPSQNQESKSKQQMPKRKVSLEQI